MRRIAKNRGKYLFGFLVLCVILGLSSRRIFLVHRQQSLAFPEEGTVTAVYDGDTIKIRFANGQVRKARLIGIDSPELETEWEDVKFQALMAKRFTFFHLYRKKIRLTYDWQLEDKYGRVLVYVWTEDHGLFNKFILSEGFASVFLNFPFKFRDDFIAAQQEARRLKRGFWKEGNYPLLSVEETRDSIGKISTVEYRCIRVRKSRHFIFLDSAGEFSVLIPYENASSFPEANSFSGQVLSVTGFLEEFRKRPQMVAFLPSQIKLRKK